MPINRVPFVRRCLQDQNVSNEKVEEQHSEETYEYHLGNNVYISADKFFNHPDGSSIVWMYYNPDSEAGGQYVTNFIPLDDIKEAASKHNEPDSFFDYLGSIARQEIADVGTAWYADARIQYEKTADFEYATEETMQNLITFANATHVELDNTDEDTILQELNGYNTESLPVYDREMDILYAVLHALRIYDITLDYNSDGLVARDEETEWNGAEFYNFLIDDAIVFEDDGSVAGIREKLHEDFKALCDHYGVACKIKENHVSTNIGNVPI